MYLGSSPSGNAIFLCKLNINIFMTDTPKDNIINFNDIKKKSISSNVKKQIVQVMKFELNDGTDLIIGKEVTSEESKLKQKQTEDKLSILTRIFNHEVVSNSPELHNYVDTDTVDFVNFVSDTFGLDTLDIKFKNEMKNRMTEIVVDMLNEQIINLEKAETNEKMVDE